jgi:hypothetical protein
LRPLQQGAPDALTERDAVLPPNRVIARGALRVRLPRGVGVVPAARALQEIESGAAAEEHAAS